MRVLLKGLLDPLADRIAGSGISPNSLTILGAASHLWVTWLLSQDRLALAALLLLVTSGIDGIDGTLARRTGRVSKFGAYLDSSLDRVSEILVYLGLILLASGTDARADAPPVWLIYLALCGSLMVSYTRARAEGIGHPTEVGILTRFERMSILWLGLLSGYLTVALVVITIGAWFTAAQRIWDVWRQTSAVRTPAPVPSKAHEI